MRVPGGACGIGCVGKAACHMSSLEGMRCVLRLLTLDISLCSSATLPSVPLHKRLPPLLLPPTLSY